MKFIDTHQRPLGMPPAARTAQARHHRSRPAPAAGPGAVACRARHWPAGVPVGMKLANDQDIESSPPTCRVSRWWCCTSRSGPTVAPTARPACCARAALRRRGARTGDVLVDMVPLLARTGFDEVVLRGDQSVDAARRALGFFPGHYQGDVHEQPAAVRQAAQAERADAGQILRQPIGTDTEFAATPGSRDDRYERHRSLYARATAGFDAKSRRARRWPCCATRRRDAAHAGRIVQATSLGAEDMVVTDLIARHGLPIAVATLDTGKLHPETAGADAAHRTMHYGLQGRGVPAGRRAR
jgi:hypothetical protein